MKANKAMAYLAAAIRLMNLKQVKKLTQGITMEEINAIGRADSEAAAKIIHAHEARTAAE